jgi:phage shock protein C
MNKQLRRSRVNKVIAGVCGGIGEYFDVDPILIRIIFVAATFAGGAAIFVYIICWIIIPETPFVIPTSGTPSEATSPPMPPPSPPYSQPKNGKTGAVIGIGLVLVGLLFLLDNFIETISFWKFWPLILIALGAAVIYNQYKKM